MSAELSETVAMPDSSRDVMQKHFRFRSTCRPVHFRQSIIYHDAMDMNLLVALDALLEENSVAAAAQRLHLTPPAVSRTLARIRHATGDDILVRSGRSMTPTPYALSIRDEVGVLVRTARGLLRPARQLDLANLVRVFSIRGHDALISLLAPTLTIGLADSAPFVQLRFLAEAPADSPELARGQIDLELGATVPTLPEISSEVLAEDVLVIALRKGHKLARGLLSIKRFAQASHVTVSRRGRLQHGVVDESLAGHGLQRRVVASLPTTSAALEVVAQSDSIAIIPSASCRLLCKAFQLQIRAVPLKLPRSPVVLSWHRRHDSDPAHQWLRARVSDVIRNTKWPPHWNGNAHVRR
jgi:DNA-binding transcriptional LysR family regulator